MIYDVEFSLDAAGELLRIAEVVGSAVLVLQAAEAIRRQLENDPAEKGTFLSEGLYYIDEQTNRTSAGRGSKVQLSLYEHKNLQGTNDG